MYIPDFMKWTPFYSAAILGLERFIVLFIEAGYNLSHESWLLKGDYPVELSKNREFCLYLRQYARKPKTLRDECRLRIRSLLGFGDKCNKNVSTLDLPEALKYFI